jgi:anti-sigma B factor antagonist
MASVEPLRISVDEERQVVAVAQELIGVSDFDLHPERDTYGIRRERSSEDIFVVSLAGEHDLYTAPKVQEALRSVIAAGARTTVVDLSETTFLDSTMLQVFLRARNELRDGGRLLLVSNDATIKRVFQITGFDRFFDFYPSRSAAEEVRSA